MGKASSLVPVRKKANHEKGLASANENLYESQSRLT
jgi:hypothetical protein